MNRFKKISVRYRIRVFIPEDHKPHLMERWINCSPQLIGMIQRDHYITIDGRDHKITGRGLLAKQIGNEDTVHVIAATLEDITIKKDDRRLSKEWKKVDESNGKAS